MTCGDRSIFGRRRFGAAVGVGAGEGGGAAATVTGATSALAFAMGQTNSASPAAVSFFSVSVTASVSALRPARNNAAAKSGTASAVKSSGIWASGSSNIPSSCASVVSLLVPVASGVAYHAGSRPVAALIATIAAPPFQMQHHQQAWTSSTGRQVVGRKRCCFAWGQLKLAIERSGQRRWPRRLRPGRRPVHRRRIV